MRSPASTLARRPLIVLASVVLAATVFSSCGGSDETTALATGEATQNTSTATGDTGETNSDDENVDAPIGVDEDGDITFSDDAGDAISAVGFETVVEIAADQLDPKPEVSFDGNDATLRFAEGSVDADAWLPCGVVGAFLEDGQTVTVVYPDGELLCG